MKRNNFIEFNLVECGKEQCLPQKSVEPKSKDCYTIHYIISGEGYIKYNGIEVKLRAGDAFIIYPHMLVEYYPSNKKPWSYYWVVFNGLLAQNIEEELPFTRENIYNTIGKQKVLEEYFENAVSSYVFEGEITFETMGWAYLIINKLIELNLKNNENRCVNQQEKHVREIKEFIQFNYYFDISINEIARSQCINLNYMCNIFKKYSGVTPKQYIKKLRMERAIEVLKNYDIKVSDVAKMLGYKDALYFSKEFKKYFGFSPSQVLNNDIVKKDKQY